MAKCHERWKDSDPEVELSLISFDLMLKAGTCVLAFFSTYILNKLVFPAQAGIQNYITR